MMNGLAQFFLFLLIFMVLISLLVALYKDRRAILRLELRQILEASIVVIIVGIVSHFLGYDKQALSWFSFGWHWFSYWLKVFIILSAAIGLLVLMITGAIHKHRTNIRKAREEERKRLAAISQRERVEDAKRLEIKKKEREQQIYEREKERAFWVKRKEIYDQAVTARAENLCPKCLAVNPKRCYCGNCLSGVSHYDHLLKVNLIDDRGKNNYCSSDYSGQCWSCDDDDDSSYY
ncbi:MAG: hypothetical protein V1838_01330 [Patescibacteria group bacterium]